MPKQYFNAYIVQANYRFFLKKRQIKKASKLVQDRKRK